MGVRSTKEEIKEIKAMYTSGYSVSQISKKYKKHHSSICRILGKMEERPRVRLDFKQSCIDVSLLINELVEARDFIDKILNKLLLKNRSFEG